MGYYVSSCFMGARPLWEGFTVSLYLCIWSDLLIPSSSLSLLPSPEVQLILAYIPIINSLFFPVIVLSAVFAKRDWWPLRKNSGVPVYSQMSCWAILGYRSDKSLCLNSYLRTLAALQHLSYFPYSCHSLVMKPWELLKSSSSGPVGCPNRKVYFDNAKNSNTLSHLSLQSMLWKEMPLWGPSSHSSSPTLRYWEITPSKRTGQHVLPSLSPGIEWFARKDTVLPSQWHLKGEIESKKFPDIYNPCFKNSECGFPEANNCSFSYQWKNYREGVSSPSWALMQQVLSCYL